ncbi:MAG: hypothetical protein R3195_02290 [Gemmatimonadota bacterium]|nr:hypothetical protein [Gemmatimonadota bacterium]
MSNVFRKLRGLVGNGLVWAGAWTLGSLVFSIIPAVASGLGIPLSALGLILVNGAVVGFASGALFSLVLGIAYRNRLLDDIRPVPMGILGASAGLMIPVTAFLAAGAAGLVFPPAVVAANLVTAGLLGAGTSVASLKLAQQAGPALSGTDEDVGRLAAG